MKKILFLILLLPSWAMALEAVVTVLEAPILEEKSRYSKVVQYLRKGDVIKIHPSINNDEQYDYLAPTPEKMAQVKKKLAERPEWQEDKIFTGDESLNGHIEDEFIPVLDRRGRRAYVISEHIYVYFENKKEFRHARFNNKDRTDYRLQEPLPRNYPLIRQDHKRGQLLIGFTQPYDQSYPYKLPVKTKGYMSPADLQFSYMNNAKSDDQDRFFYGINVGFRYYTNQYVFTGDERTSRERTFKAGIGPVVTYDVYKGEKNRVALMGRMNVYLLNLLQIEQSANDGRVDNRRYQSVSTTPSIGVQYHRKSVFEDVDVVVGSNIETELGTQYRAQNGAKYSDWWRHGGNDRFQPGASFNIVGYIGLQSVY